MQKKIVISMAVVALLLMGVMATSVLASSQTLVKNTAVSDDMQAIAKVETAEIAVSVRERSVASVRATNRTLVTASGDSITSDGDNTDAAQEVDLDGLRDAVPSTYDETDARLSTQRVRFLLYTHDGNHIMWGYVGNGYFVGTDNQGKRCWGIYGNNVFAGFYDGNFFWGKYRGDNWKAEELFGLNSVSGKYILFPTPALTADTP